jgi:uncharacterized membrane protein
MHTKTLASCAVFLLVLAMPVHAYVQIQEYSTTLEVMDKEVLETVKIALTASNESIFEFRVTPEPEGLTVLVNNAIQNCSLVNEIFSSLVSCDIKPGKNTVIAKYVTSYSTIQIQNSERLARHNHIPTYDTRNFSLLIKLPEDANINNIGQDIIPKANSITSDGKSIILEWSKDEVREPFGVTVLFHKTSTSSQILFALLVAGIGATIATFFISRKNIPLLLEKKESHPDEILQQRNNSHLIYPDLIESEKKVVESLKANYNVLRQRELVDITGFSKAKMSRLLKQMEERKIVYTKPYGNSKKIYLNTKKIRETLDKKVE